MARVRTAFRGRTRALDPEVSLSSGDGPTVTGTNANGEVCGGNDARERILDAAEDLFAADGFDATPTSRIAHRAAVAKGLLFYYFPRKMDLLRTLFRERLPMQPLSGIIGIAVKGDMAGSLVRLADRCWRTSGWVLASRKSFSHRNTCLCVDRGRRTNPGSRVLRRAHQVTVLSGRRTSHRRCRCCRSSPGRRR